MSRLEPPTSFAAALQLQHSRQGGFTTRFPSSFCFGSRAHGGLLVSLVHRAIAMHFESVPDRPDRADVLDLKIHFFHPTLADDITIFVDDVSIGMGSSTVEVRSYQGKRLHLIGLVTVGNFDTIRGISFDTRWSLFPPPMEASIPQLASDADPRWISYQCPWHPQSYRRPQSYVKFFVPIELSDPSFRDSWLTPSDSSFAFKNEHLGFVADMTLPILDNFYGERGAGSQAACITLGFQQKKNREQGIAEVADVSSGSLTTPVTSVTLSLNMEVKKRLPTHGVRWLFSRSRAKEIKEGRMDNEIVIPDEHGELVALVHQVLQVIDIARAQGSRAKM